MSDAARLLEALQARGWRVACAESLTGGMVTSELVEVPGASASVVGGVVAYGLGVKRSVLGVDGDLLAAHGAVHPEVAAQMARGVRRVLRLEEGEPELGLATTGIAGPASPDGQPVGTAFLCVSTPGGVRVEKHVFEGDRGLIRRQAVDGVIGLALDAL